MVVNMNNFTNKDILKYFLLKSIKDTLSQDIATTEIQVQDIKITQDTFLERVISVFLTLSLPFFTMNEIKDFLEDILEK